MDITELKPVTSSNLAAVGYHGPTRTLAVRFKGSNATHHYGNVDPEHHEALMGAESIGSHFSKHIRGNPDHPYTPPAKEH